MGRYRTAQTWKIIGMFYSDESEEADLDESIQEDMVGVFPLNTIRSILTTFTTTRQQILVRKMMILMMQLTIAEAFIFTKRKRLKKEKFLNHLMEISRV